MDTQSDNSSPRVLHERAFLYVFLAFVLGFALPVCSCLGSGAVMLASMGRAATGVPSLPQATSAAVAIVRIEGLIASSDSFASEAATPEQIGELLAQAAADPMVRAVILRINSPGGGVVASDEIYRAVRDLDKPVVVSMGDMAASGGYYIACGADYVFAHPGTLTGSIGVISEFPNIQELLTKIGVEMIVITSGPAKDIGSPYRDMTSEERALWEEIILETYDGFVAIVAEGRGLDVEDVRTLADGRVYTGRQALELGLIDELGLLEDAIAKAAELGGIEGEPQVIELVPPASFYDLVMGYQSQSGFPALEDLLTWGSVPALEYRYAGP